MSYWTDDEIEAYKKEMIERQRMDRESSKAYTERLIGDLSATVEANKATIEANKAALADKDATIADLLRRIASLESMPKVAKA